MQALIAVIQTTSMADVKKAKRARQRNDECSSYSVLLWWSRYKP